MKQYLDAKQLQGKTGLSRPVVYRMLNDPSCPVIRFGRSIRVLESDFDEWARRKFGVISVNSGEVVM